MNDLNSGKPHICFVGLENLPVLAREYNNHVIGGEQVQQTLLATAFARRGYQVSMVTGDYGQADGQTWNSIKTIKAYDPVAGIPGLRFFHPRWTGLSNALLRANADIYYWSCAAVQLGQIALFAGSKHRKFVFRVAHDTDCDPKQLMVPYFRDKLFYQYGLKRCDAILVQSRQQQVALKTNYDLPGDIATMLVDRPGEILEFDQRDLPILWVNNIRQFKRPDLYLALAKLLPHVTLHMIGGTQPGFEMLHQQIEQGAKEIKNFVFHGRVPYHDVNDFYARSLLFVNTSDSEGFPNSYLQAWARGTPVVAYFDPDGVIAREGLGYTVKTADEMRRVITELLANKSRWIAASKRCITYMNREYSEENILKPYQDVFERLHSTKRII